MVTQTDVWPRLLQLAQAASTVGWRQMFKPRQSDRATELVADLGLVGDDALQFMNDYATLFSLDWAEFRFDAYFEPEQLWLLPSLRRRRTKQVLTLGMLEAAALAGRWGAWASPPPKDE